VADEKRVYNQAAVVARNCWIGALIGVLLFFYPIVFPPSTYGLNFAMMFAAIIIFFSGIISAIIFQRLAGNLNRLVAGEGLLAHWTYSQDEWSRYTEEEHLRDRKDKWGLFRLISIIAVIVGIIFVIFKHDALPVILVVIPGLIAIIAATAALTISSTFRQNRLHPGEVYIGKSGALLGREFHYWKLPTAYLQTAVFEAGNPPVIKLVYSSPSGYARGEYIARFPVPQGREEEAKQVLAQLKGEKTDI
jgi:uncharacterized membrane protein